MQYDRLADHCRLDFLRATALTQINKISRILGFNEFIHSALDTEGAPRMKAAVDRRFLFVTGKGGVGKSLVSAALAARAARRGERTLWVEMAESPRGGELFPGFDPGYDLTRISDSLWGMNLRLQPAIEEYLAVVFKLPLITRVIARNTLFQILTGALPGLDSLIPLGKLWYELERRRGGSEEGHRTQRRPPGPAREGRGGGEHLPAPVSQPLQGEDATQEEEPRPTAACHREAVRGEEGRV